MVPHFAHGDYIFMHRDRDRKMYGHKVSEAARLPDGVLQIRDNRDLDEEILSLPCLIDRMFAYVETKEPLNVYKARPAGGPTRRATRATAATAPGSSVRGRGGLWRGRGEAAAAVASDGKQQ